MFPPRPTSLAHTILRERIHAGDHVIDATAGNGHDTLFLAECIGEGGTVHAFDVQESALSATRSRLRAAGMEQRALFHHASHAAMADFCEARSISAVMFNLGYLPGEDHQVTTRTEETLDALATASSMLKPGGVLSVLCYPGHDEGTREATAVESWFAQQAATGWRVARYGMPFTQKPAPFLLLAGKP
jgi:ubiquinone/menaquinone biosynthesis C-methylase UbiE